MDTSNTDHLSEWNYQKDRTWTWYPSFHEVVNVIRDTPDPEPDWRMNPAPYQPVIGRPKHHRKATKAQRKARKQGRK